MRAPLAALLPALARSAAVAEPFHDSWRSAERVRLPTSLAVAAHARNRRHTSSASNPPQASNDSERAIAIWVSSVNSPGAHPNGPPPSISPTPPSTGSGNSRR